MRRNEKPFVCGNPKCKEEFDGEHLTDSQREDARREKNPTIVLCQKCCANGESAASVRAHAREQKKRSSTGEFECGVPSCRDKFDGDHLTAMQRKNARRKNPQMVVCKDCAEKGETPAAVRVRMREEKKKGNASVKK